MLLFLKSDSLGQYIAKSPHFWKKKTVFWIGLPEDKTYSQVGLFTSEEAVVICFNENPFKNNKKCLSIHAKISFRF